MIRRPATRRRLGAAAALLLGAITATLRAQEIAVQGGVVELRFAGQADEKLQQAAHTWAQNSARAVATYYGRFPVRRAVVNIMPIDGRKVEGGQAFGSRGASIKISLGRHATEASLADDWHLPHEMLHLGFPDLAERHHWLEEGLASYVEPIARARARLITPTRVWSDLVEGLPQGQPEPGDRGLDRTHTWGRTYWGGALFCLRADVEIRRRTGNRRGLEHALRAILAAGGNIENSWPMDRVISVGDTATGVPVLRELYEDMKAQPVTVDLPALWKKLGVVRRLRTVSFDDSAPLAAVRRAITGG